MKIDHGMHIVMHLVFFGKTDVTREGEKAQAVGALGAVQ
jgi:hypothetical protein